MLTAGTTVLVCWSGYQFHKTSIGKFIHSSGRTINRDTSPLCTTALPKELLLCCREQGQYYPCSSTLSLWRVWPSLARVLCDKTEKELTFLAFREVWNLSILYSHHSLKVLWGVGRGLWHFPCLLGFIFCLLWLDSSCTLQNSGLNDGQSSLLLKREQNCLIYSVCAAIWIELVVLWGSYAVRSFFRRDKIKIVFLLGIWLFVGWNTWDGKEPKGVGIVAMNVQ